MRQILIKIGFRYRKRGRERIFYERGDIVSWREKYLRRIKQIREQEPERDIVYLDETYLTEGHQKNKEWVDTSTLKDPQKTKSLSLTTGYTNLHVGKGRRIVISDAITENGTVPGALWIYIAASKKSTGKGQTENKKKCGSSSSSKVSVENKDNDDNQGDSGLGIEQDYHDEMDHEKYENYFETQICKNVSKNSALVIDNASSFFALIIRNILKTIQNRHGKKLNMPNGLKKERSLMQKMLYDRPYGSWQKKSGRITLHIGWKKLPTNMDMK